MRGSIQRCAILVRMSRAFLALLTCVPPTASQVTIADSKTALDEVKNFNLFADAGFRDPGDLRQIIGVRGES